MAKTQRIVVLLNLGPDQEPYPELEFGEYDALRHFFEDIDYDVQSITSEVKDVKGIFTEEDIREGEAAGDFDEEE